MHTDTSRYDDAAKSEAREEALRDSDSFANWLSIQCDRVQPLPWEPVWSEALLAEGEPDFPARSTAGLLVLALDVAQKPATRIAALNCIADRYCATPNVAALIGDRADDLGRLMAEDAREAA